MTYQHIGGGMTIATLAGEYWIGSTPLALVWFEGPDLPTECGFGGVRFVRCNHSRLLPCVSFVEWHAALAEGGRDESDL